MHIPMHFTAFAAALLAAAAQHPLDPTVRTWSRTYGGSVSEQGLHAIRQMPGGRLVAAGYTASFGGPTQSSWLLSLSLSTGDVRYEQVCNSSFGGYTDGAAIAADGGVLFLGRDVHDIFTKHDAWLVRVDATGAVQWTQGFTRPGDGRHFLFDAAELADGSWIAVGATSIQDHPPQPAWIVRLSSTGAVLWQYEYGGGSAETARSVTPTADGGFAVAGHTDSSGAGSDDVWVMKIDSAGAIQWQKTYGSFDSDQAEQIVELDDGGFAVVGMTNSLTSTSHAPWILRLSGTGALVWHEAVDAGVWGDLGAAAKTNDGQLVVVGRVAEPGFQTNDLWCAKLRVSDGAFQWQRAYEGTLGDFGTAVLPIAGPGAGYVVGGTWGWGFPGESIWLERTDRTGGLNGCGLERKTSFTTISPAITVAIATLVRAPGGAQTFDPGVVVGPSAADVIERCP